MKKNKQRKKHQLASRSFALLLHLARHRFSKNLILLFFAMSASLVNTYLTGQYLQISLTELLEISSASNESLVVSFDQRSKSDAVFDFEALDNKLKSVFSRYQKKHSRVLSQSFANYLSRQFPGSIITIHHANTGIIFLRVDLPNPKFVLGNPPEFYISENGSPYPIKNFDFKTLPPQLLDTSRANDPQLYLKAIELITLLNQKKLSIEWLKYEKGRGFSAVLKDRQIRVTFGKIDFERRINRLVSLVSVKSESQDTLEQIELDFANKAVILEKKM